MAKRKCVKCGSSSFFSSYHKLPKTPERRIKWLERLKLSPRKVLEHSTVCSTHFYSSDINRVRLKRGVVPRRLTYDENGNVPETRRENVKNDENTTVHRSSVSVLQLGVNLTRAAMTDISNIIPASILPNQLEMLPIVTAGVDTEVRIPSVFSNQNNCCFHGQQQTTKLLGEPISSTPRGFLQTQNKRFQGSYRNTFTLPTSDSTQPTFDVQKTNGDGKIDILKKKVKHLSQQNRRLIKKLKSTTPTQQMETLLQKSFGDSPGFLEIIKSQFQRYTRGASSHYSSVEKTTCLTVYYACGRNGYQTLLNLGWKLPALSTIRFWIKNLDLGTGLNEDMMTCLKQRVHSMTEKERDCVITWDEVSIKEHLEYSKDKDELVGIVDHGAGHRKLELATEALVVMIRGVNANWKFPISYYFSNGSTTSTRLDAILRENLLKIKEVGFKVRIGICDMSFTNQGLYRLWGVTKDRPYIMSACDKIYMVHDTPHLIKLVRNNLQRRNFIVNGMPVKWYWILRFYQLDTRRACRHAPRLTKLHFNLKDYSKMKVKLATQVFSHSVFAGMKTFMRLKLLKPEAKCTASFVKDIDEMFDLLNISELENTKSVKAAKNIFSNLQLFDKFCRLIRSIVVPGCKGGRPDCLKGLELTLTGIKDLICDLKTEGYKFVLTRRLQQDCIEHFFAFIRLRGGWNRNPTASQFKYNFRYQFFSHMIKSPVGSNCEYIREDTLFTCVEKLKSVFKSRISTLKSPVPLREVYKSPRPFVSGTLNAQDMDVGSMALQRESNSNFFPLDPKLTNKVPTVQEINVSNYMANSICKRVVRKSNCEKCKILFHSSNDWDDINDTFMCYKAFSPKLLNDENSQYSLKLKNEHAKVFFNICHDFEEEIERCLNYDGKNILSNITASLLDKSYVSLWVNSDVSCVLHRKTMISKVLLAKIFRLVKDKNEIVKQSKSWTQTRRELRNQ